MAWKSGLLAVLIAIPLVRGAVHRVDAPMVPNVIHTASASRETSVIVSPIHAASHIVTTSHEAASTLLPAVDQADIRPEHRVIADNVLRSLPPHCAKYLKNFYVIYDPKNTQRGLGGASTIVITGLVPDDEFRALIIHECGHVTDLGGLRGSPESGRTEFMDGATPVYNDDPSVAFYRISWASALQRKPGVRATDFASGYAATDAFEDFAEHFAFYALQREAFAEIAEQNPILAQKYVFMRDVVFGERADITVSKYTPARTVPWDITKLSYAWIVQ